MATWGLVVKWQRGKRDSVGSVGPSQRRERWIAWLKETTQLMVGPRWEQGSPSVKRERVSSFWIHSDYASMLFVFWHWARLLFSKVCTYCSVQRVSLCGDPNLSPGGLRVLARVRSSIFVLLERVATTIVGSIHWKRQRIQWEGGRSLGRRWSQIEGLSGDSARESWKGVSPSLCHHFCRVGGHYLQQIIQD